jgi:ABC-type sugar transport system permease subunit
VIDIIGTIAMYDLVRMLTDGGPRRATETIAYYLWRKTFLDGRIDFSATISMVLLVGLVLLIGLYLRLVAKGGLSDGTSF